MSAVELLSFKSASGVTRNVAILFSVHLDTDDLFRVCPREDFGV